MPVAPDLGSPTEVAWVDFVEIPIHCCALRSSDSHANARKLRQVLDDDPEHSRFVQTRSPDGGTASYRRRYVKLGLGGVQTDSNQRLM